MDDKQAIEDVERIGVPMFGDQQKLREKFRRNNQQDEEYTEKGKSTTTSYAAKKQSPDASFNNQENTNRASFNDGKLSLKKAKSIENPYRRPLPQSNPHNPPSQSTSKQSTTNTSKNDKPNYEQLASENSVYVNPTDVHHPPSYNQKQCPQSNLSHPSQTSLNYNVHLNKDAKQQTNPYASNQINYNYRSQSSSTPNLITPNPNLNKTKSFNSETMNLEQVHLFYENNKNSNLSEFSPNNHRIPKRSHPVQNGPIDPNAILHVRKKTIVNPYNRL